MVQALGARLRDANGVDIGDGGGSLACLNSIDLSALDVRLQDVQFAWPAMSLTR
jgi:glycerate kinase